VFEITFWRMLMKRYRKWINVYPQGTKEGDEEQRFFISLARHPKYEWRSMAAVAKESGLEKKRVEQIIQKYYKKGMVFQNPKNEDQWGYWERLDSALLNLDQSKSMAEKDHEQRIKDYKK
jgi:hypothetical protein